MLNLTQNFLLCLARYFEGFEDEGERGSKEKGGSDFWLCVLLGNAFGETRDPDIRIHCRRHVTSNQPGIVSDIDGVGGCSYTIQSTCVIRLNCNVRTVLRVVFVINQTRNNYYSPLVRPKWKFVNVYPSAVFFFFFFPRDVNFQRFVETRRFIHKQYTD